MVTLNPHSTIGTVIGITLKLRMSMLPEVVKLPATISKNIRIMLISFSVSLKDI